MPTLELTLLLKQDGVAVPGFPIVRRVAVDSVETFDQPFDDNGAGVYTAVGGVVEASVIIFRSLDQPVIVRLNGQTNAGNDLLAGGVLVIFGGDIDAGVATNLTVNNDSGSATQIQGVIAG